MARKLRLEEEGGFCHVINRGTPSVGDIGHYRQWVFAEEGSKLV